MIHISKLLRIGNKLIIIGIVLALVPTIILGSILYTKSKKSIEEALVLDLKTYATAKSQEIYNYIDHLDDLGYFISADDKLFRSLNSLSYTNYDLDSWEWSNIKPKIEDLGQQILERTDFDVFLLLTPSGALAYSTNHDDVPGTDFSNRDYVKGALEGYLTFSNLFYSDITKDNCIGLGVPVKDPSGNNIVGAISFVITGEHIERILQNGIEQLGASASAYLIDQHGTLLTNLSADSQGPELNEKIEGWPVDSISKAISVSENTLKTTTGTYRNYAQKHVLGSASILEIGNFTYGLIIEVDQNEAFAGLSALKSSTIGVGAIVLAAAIAIAIWFSNTMVVPINHTVSMVRNIAKGQGDLTQRLEARTTDEIGELATWFNRFLDYISGIIADITATSDHLAATSQELSATSEESTSIAEQISETANQLATGAAEQSGTAANTAEAAEKLSMAVEKVAQGTQAQHGAVDTIAVVLSETNRVFAEVLQALENVSTVASDNTTAANRAAESIQVLSASMSNIQTANESAAIQVSELHDLSQSIRQIVSVIDDIASQTNLLALNAAIEAARAGEHGRGFAVVADEVRKLAERSLAETKSISDLIGKVASSIDHTVSSIEQSTQEIQQGSLVADDANIVLSEISEAATGTQQEVSHLMASFEKLKEASAQTETAINDIAIYAGENLSGVEEMAISSEEVKRLVENVAAVSQESAAAIEQVAASIKEMAAATDQVSSSAQDLAEQAEALQGIVRKFKV